jgi:hypothetical protein
MSNLLKLFMAHAGKNASRYEVEIDSRSKSSSNNFQVKNASWKTTLSEDFGLSKFLKIFMTHAGKTISSKRLKLIAGQNQSAEIFKIDGNVHQAEESITNHHQVLQLVFLAEDTHCTWLNFHKNSSNKSVLQFLAQKASKT